MTRKFIIALLGGILSLSFAQADTIIPAGNVSGTWTLAGSPYLIQGDISVLTDSTLTLEPGVLVNFQGDYTFTVNGFLEAVGTESDSIRFAGTATWSGVNFTNAPDSSHLVYCCLNNAFTPVTCNNSDPVISHSSITGGGFLGSIYVPNPCSPRISDCHISDAGRGIWWSSGASGTISGCVISNMSLMGILWSGSASGTISGSTISGCGQSGVFKTAGNLTFIGCTISNNNNDLDNYGGGVHSQSGNVNFIDCTISNDTTYTGEGGGVGCYNGTATFTNCTINGNYSQDLSSSPYIGGGGISLYNANAILSYCTIFDNWAVPQGGAISIYNSGNLSIDHCTIDGNEADCGMYPGSAIVVLGSSTTADITNSIISNNYSWTSSGRAIYTEGTLTVEYSDFYHNYPGGDISGNIPTGFGILDSTNTNGDSCDCYFDIFMNPMFADTANYDYHLTANSPCIDAGDPTSPWDPDSTLTDMGCYFFDQSVTPPPIAITLIPLNYPFIILPGGGSFQFDATVTNNSSTPMTFQAWIKVQLPNLTWYGPVLGPITLTLPANLSITRRRTQIVPGSAPGGLYTYRGWVGTYPSAPLDSSSFTFTKQGTGIQDSGFDQWTNLGDEFPQQVVGSQIHPLSFILYPSSPNPFNATTAIRYELRASSYVSLKVYDIAGRLVTTLVDGWREAGEHQVRFDGSGLASGVYLYRLSAGEFSASGKMLLLK